MSALESGDQTKHVIFATAINGCIITSKVMRLIKGSIRLVNSEATFMTTVYCNGMGRGYERHSLS